MNVCNYSFICHKAFNILLGLSLGHAMKKLLWSVHHSNMFQYHVRVMWKEEFYNQYINLFYIQITDGSILKIWSNKKKKNNEKVQKK